MNRLEFDYKTSKDYKRLWTLMERKRIICFINKEKRKSDGSIIKEIITTPIKIDYNYTRFLDAFDLEEFIKHCNYYNLEFIDIEDK